MSMSRPLPWQAPAAITGEEPDLGHDLRRSRIVEGDTDDLDLPAVGVGVGRDGIGRERVILAVQTRFVRVSEPRCPAVVEIDDARIVEVLDQAVGVRAAAGLDEADLLWIFNVADVPDADAAHAVGVGYVGRTGALGPAVGAAGGVLHGREQEIAVDVDVTLPSRAESCDHEARVRRVGDVVDPVSYTHLTLPTIYSV